jgi:peptidoglycan/LPS O-acetylase OafA/YrhL
MTKNNKVYFKNLNAVRFIAAFLVIIHHIEQFKSLFNLKNAMGNEFIEIIGKLGVVMFFVLSGFLISFLIFKEKELTNTISVRNFYIRRILKIWPLYFVIVFAAFYIFPHLGFFSIPNAKGNVSDDFFVKILLYAFFLPNLALRLFAAIPYVSHVWSIGAEEQFYLIWPVLNKRINNKWMLMFGVITVYLIIKFSLMLVSGSSTIKVISAFWGSTPIDCMAIGGLFALTIFEKTKFTARIRALIFTKIAQWMTLILTATLIAFGVKIPIFHYEFYSVLFGILICNFAANDHRIFSMENKLFNYLGKISYGLYMYHPIVIVAVIKSLQYFGIITNYAIFPLVILLVVALSALSYEYFEKWFISLKSKYSKLVSGNEAKSLNI